MRIQRIQPVPLAKILGVMYAVMGLVVGALFSLIGMVIPAFGATPQTQNVPGWSLFFGVGAIVVLPVIYGCIGLLSGLIGAALYNVFAKMVGGVVVEVE